MMSALPAAYGTSPTRKPAPGGSRLLQMQARFQAKQLVEKEEKLINLLEEKQDDITLRMGLTREAINSGNSLSSTTSSNSLTGGLGGRPPLYGGGGRVRQMFEERRHQQQTRTARISPIGWDKSYPLEPVQAVNGELRAPLYKQNSNVSRTNSYNKYSGNYGPRTGGSNNGKRGLSLDRSFSSKHQNGYGYQRSGIVRTQSQANLQGGSSSEDSSRPHSGFGYHNRSNSSRFEHYQQLSPEDSPPLVRRGVGAPPPVRDYTRPLPPSYRRERDSPARHSYHDSAYSSHSSDRSDANPSFSVMGEPTRPPLSTQSSPVKSYSRQSSFSYDNGNKLNTRTFRKQKSPTRRGTRSPSISPTRSGEYSDTEDYAARVKSRTAEREREEERRRMQVEMRRREQELLARIKDQQRELESVKQEKIKMERELSRQEREREAERRILEERRRKEEEEDEKRDRELQILRRSQSQERILTRERATPALLRGRRPPPGATTTLVSSPEEEEENTHRFDANFSSKVEIRIPIQREELPRISKRFEVARDREDKVSDDDIRGPSTAAYTSNTLPRKLPSSQNSSNDELKDGVSFKAASDRLFGRQNNNKSIHNGANSNSGGTLPRSKETKRPLLSQMRETLVAAVTPRQPNAFMKETRASFRRRSLIQAEPEKEARPAPALARTGSLRRPSGAAAPEESNKVGVSRSYSFRHKPDKSRVEPGERRPAAEPGRLAAPTKEEGSGEGMRRRAVSQERLERSASQLEDEERPPFPSKTMPTPRMAPRNKQMNGSLGGGYGEAKGANTRKETSPSPSLKKKAGPVTPAARRSVFAPKPRDDLVQCSNCGRNFAEDRVEKHEEICRKTSQKKRKTFDMTKARVKGTDAAAFVKSQAQLKSQETKDQKKSDWRKKREDFIATLRAAKEAQKHLAAGGSLKDLPPPPPMDTSDYIQCPHCGRRFAEGAAERHIPKCKDIKSNKRR